jgi:hypothetical protein
MRGRDDVTTWMESNTENCNQLIDRSMALLFSLAANSVRAAFRRTISTPMRLRHQSSFKLYEGVARLSK